MMPTYHVYHSASSQRLSAFIIITDITIVISIMLCPQVYQSIGGYESGKPGGPNLQSQDRLS